MRRVETSYLRLVAKALEAGNNKNVALKEQVGELDSKILGLMEKTKTSRKEAESTGSEAEKCYIANFYLTKAYQSFAKYWRRYAYTEVVEWSKTNFKTFNTSQLRSEFLEKGKKLQTLAEGSQVIEIEDKAREDEAEVDEVVASSAIIHFILSLSPPAQ